MKRHTPEHIELLCQKNIYLYEFVDHISKLDHVGLPPKEAVYSSLTKDNVSDDDYEHALIVFTTLLCVLFKDHHLIYLQAYVLLLADVFYVFRSMYFVLQIRPGK